MILLVSCIPLYLSSKAVMKVQIKRAAFMTALNIVLAMVFLIIRTIEFNRLNFKWTTDVYGSFVWILMGLHTMHVISDTIESMVFLAILMSGRVGGKQQLGVTMDGLYWYWLVAVWVPLYLLIFVYPAFTKYA